MKMHFSLLLSIGFVFATASAGITDGTCYQDDGSRLLDTQIDSATNTPEECKKACASRGYAFAGVQYTVQCFCGNDEPPASRIRDSSECDAKCPGDAALMCGGTWRMNIYKANSAGKCGWYKTHWGKKCGMCPQELELQKCKCIKKNKQTGNIVAIEDGTQELTGEGSKCSCSDQCPTNGRNCRAMMQCCGVEGKYYSWKNAKKIWGSTC